jgi:hypothetical protein
MIYTKPALNAVDFALSAFTKPNISPYESVLSSYTKPALNAVDFSTSSYTLPVFNTIDFELLTTYHGVLKRYTGASWVKAKLKVYSTSFTIKKLKRWTGTEWVEVDAAG